MIGRLKAARIVQEEFERTQVMIVVRWRGELDD
jgi:hypothetical protein